MILMKLLNLRDLDLDERCGASCKTASNVVKTEICTLHEKLFVEIIGEGIQLQCKCQISVPQCFNDFGSSRLVINATEIKMDIHVDMNKLAACYSNYKSRHTVEVLIRVGPNAIVNCSKAYPRSTSDVALVQHSGLVILFCPGDLIKAD